MTDKSIPDIVVGRLPQYLRTLHHMSAEGRTVTSSQELGERLGISAAQIRKDLSQFGEFGKQGTGYQINYLVKQLIRILNVEKLWDVAIVGAGDIGHAIARYQGFKDHGFRVTMIFDNDPEKIGKKIDGFEIQDASRLIEIIRKSGIRIAMLTVPADQAQMVADELIEAGVEAILNYAPIHICVPENVRIQHIDPVIHLQRMTYYI